MALVLGVDGGGTGCRAAVARVGGPVLGRGAAGPANISIDLEGAAANILAACEAALREAGGGEVRAAVLGLAGANVTAQAARLQGMLPFGAVRIVSDAVIAAKGALGAEDGILALLGTGSVFAVQQGGAIRLHGGRGFLMGDEGSGAVLGRALLRAALRADDGFRAMTPLLAQVLDELGGAEAAVAFALTARPADFARFAPRLLDSDDAAAVEIVGAEVAEVAEILRALKADALPVTFIGGLGPFYAGRLAGQFAVRVAQGSALDGALALAGALA